MYFRDKCHKNIWKFPSLLNLLSRHARWWSSMLFARDLCWSAWRSQFHHHQLEPGPLHVVCSRSLLISVAFSVSTSSTETRPSSRCLLKIFADQLDVLSFIIINWNQALFTLFARVLCWSASRSKSRHHHHVQLEPDRLHVVCSSYSKGINFLSWSLQKKIATRFESGIIDSDLRQAPRERERERERELNKGKWRNSSFW